MPLPLYFEPVEIAATCVALGFKLFCEDEPIFKVKGMHFETKEINSNI